MILFFSSFYPSYSRGGAQVRAASVLEYLHARGQTIHLVVASRRPKPSKCPRETARFTDAQSTISLAGRPLPGVVPLALAKTTRPPRSAAVRLVQSWADWLRRRPTLAEEVAALVARLRPEVIWVNGTHLAPLLAHVPRTPGQLRVVDTLDVLHRRDASLRAAGLPPEGGLSREEETALLERFDVVLAIQEEERQLLAEMLPGQQVLTVPHACVVTPQPTHRPAVVFVGSSGQTNRHGLETFLTEAWPQILRADPDVQLEVVGSVCQAESLRQLASQPAMRLVLRGSLPKIAEAYDGPAVVICPLWAGSGLKIKMVEALAHGKAVVASPIAAQGLEAGSDRAFRLAKTPAAFAPAVLELLADEAARTALATAATAFAGRSFGPAAAYGELEHVLRSHTGSATCTGKAA